MFDPLVLLPLFLLAWLGLLEAAVPARRLPAVPGWRAIGLIATCLAIVLNFYAPRLWSTWFETSLLTWPEQGLAIDTLLAFLALELAIYVWHRGLHAITPLWRIHQMHHAAERIDVFGALYFHPLDTIGFALAGSAMLGGVLGAPVDAAGLAGGLATFCAIFQHANLRTPVWLGWLIQRPESHAAHHERGVHARNYGDIALWDLVFGTFVNPRRFPRETGLGEGASRRFGALLAGRDVTRRGGP